MDQERERIQADLRGLLDGDVFCDDFFVQMYASDASVYEIRPLGVVRPRGLPDVVACVQYAAENEIPLHARGAGTGLAGESIGPGLVVDFSHSMRRILACDHGHGPRAARRRLLAVEPVSGRAGTRLWSGSGDGPRFDDGQCLGTQWVGQSLAAVWLGR